MFGHWVGVLQCAWMCFNYCCPLLCFRDYTNELQTLLTVKDAQFQAHHTDIWNLGFALMCFSSV
jgi:hypothetical protein